MRYFLILPSTVASKFSIQMERTLRTVSFARDTAICAASSQLLSDSHRTLDHFQHCHLTLLGCVGLSSSALSRLENSTREGLDADQGTSTIILWLTKRP